MLSRWERQALHVIDITCHEQSQNTTVHYLESNQNSYSEIELIYVNLKRSNKGKEQLKTSRLEPIGNQALSQTLIEIMKIYLNLLKSFPFQTLELISQSLQPSQNRTAKDPTCSRNSWARHLHMLWKIFIRRRFTIFRRHPLPYSNNDPTKDQDLNQLSIELCRKHLSQIMKSLQLFLISDHGVDLTEPAAISKSYQRPKRKSWARHLHCTLPTTLQLLSFLLNWWSSASHKSHLWRGGRTWYPDCNWNCTDCRTRHIGKI